MATNPRYLRIKASIKEKIIDGSFAVGDRLPGERQLAASAGVSPVTAAKAINELAEEGYLRREVGVGTFVISTVATNAQRLRIHIVLFTDLDIGPEFLDKDVYFGPLFRGLTTHGARLCCDFSFSLAHQFTSLKDRLTDSRSPNERAILVAPPDKYRGQIEGLAVHGMPFVVLGARWADSGFPCIDCDNVHAGQLVVNHLTDLGHRHVAVVSSPFDTANARDRFAGAREALAARGLQLPDTHVVNVHYSPLHSPRIVDDVRALLSATPRPTAIFAAGYSLALGVRKALGELNVRVPEDISVVAFDDAASLALLDPPLTTIKQPLMEMGAAAIDFFADDAVNEPRLPAATQGTIWFPPQLVVRSSTAAVIES